MNLPHLHPASTHQPSSPMRPNFTRMSRLRDSRRCAAERMSRHRAEADSQLHCQGVGGMQHHLHSRRINRIGEEGEEFGETSSGLEPPELTCEPKRPRIGGAAGTHEASAIHTVVSNPETIPTQLGHRVCCLHCCEWTPWNVWNFRISLLTARVNWELYFLPHHH